MRIDLEQRGVSVWTNKNAGVPSIQSGSDLSTGRVNNRHDADDSKNDVNLTVPRQLCRVARSGHAVPALFIVCGRQAATKFGHLMGGL